MMKKSVVKQKEYNYTELKSVQVNKTVDIYGIVKFLKQPFKTRGRDHCMVVSLVDPSCGEDDKLKCLLFNADPARLPDVNVGDIVRFHRLKISSFNNELQGQSGPGFSWIVFSNGKDASIDPQSSLSSNYTFTDADKKMIEDLRTWSTDKEEMSVQSKVVSLENIVPQMYFDFVCQVVATCYFEDDHCFVLRVWDGTVTIYQLRKFEFSEEHLLSYDQELMKKAEDFLVDIALYDDHCENARHKIKPGDFVKLVNLHAAIYKTSETRSTDLSTIELVLHRGNSFGRSIVPASDQMLADYLSTVGNPVKMTRKSTDKLSNKKSTIVEKEKVVEDSQQPSTSKYKESERRLEISGSKTSVMFVDNDIDVVSSTSKEEQNSPENIQDYQLMEVDVVSQRPDKKRYDDVQSSGSRCMQQTVTVILGHPHIKITKISDVLQGDVPRKFRILGHVDQICPKAKDAKDFLKLYCEKCNYMCSVPAKGSDTLSLQKQVMSTCYYYCPTCNKNKDGSNLSNRQKSEHNLQYIYMMKLKISDGTGSLVALMWGKEAITFFRDLNPIELLSSKRLWREINEELDNICSNDKPLMECCIKSYTVDRHTKYQIFDTSLV